MPSRSSAADRESYACRSNASVVSQEPSPLRWKACRQARHVQGAHGPVVTVPAGVSEFEYPITLPPWMETGRTCRVCVMTIATLKDGDSEHQVSYSAIGQNDQIITVVETGQLGL